MLGIELVELLLFKLIHGEYLPKGIKEITHA